MPGTRVSCTLTLIALLAFAAPAKAQEEPAVLQVTQPAEPEMPRWAFGVGGGIGHPLGEMGDHLEPKFQFDLSGFRLWDPGRQFGLRFDAAFINHSSIKTRFQVPGTTVDLTTNNTIFTLTAGPHVVFGGWPLKACAHGGLGVTWFSTETTVGEVGENPSDTNFESSRFAWEVGGVLLFRPWKARTYMDLGARYLQNGHARFVTSEGVQINGTEMILTPTESDANMVFYRLGLSFGLESLLLNYP